MTLSNLFSAALKLEKTGGTEMTGGLEKNDHFIHIDFGSVMV